MESSRGPEHRRAMRRAMRHLLRALGPRRRWRPLFLTLANPRARATTSNSKKS